MRHYPRNSPQAAARIVTLALLSDGHLGQTELDMLDRLAAAEQLGLPRTELQTVIRGACEDLLQHPHLHWQQAFSLDTRTLAQLMAEVDDPELRRTVLHLCVAVVEADAHVADGEVDMITTAVEHWGLQQEMLRLQPLPIGTPMS